VRKNKREAVRKYFCDCGRCGKREIGVGATYYQVYNSESRGDYIIVHNECVKREDVAV
jgi:hypothetical protein